MSGEAELDRMIAKARRLPEIIKRAAPACADALRQDIARSVAAGQSPEGEAWAPRKADGGRPLVNAMAAVSVIAQGTVIEATITDRPHNVHHYGWDETKARKIIPTSSTLTDGVSAGMKKALGAEFTKAVRA